MERKVAHVAWFKPKGQPDYLPPNIVPLLEQYGRSLGPNPTGSDAQFATRVYDLIYAPLHPLAQADPQRFYDEVAAAVLPVGGWAAYGGALLGWDLTSYNEVGNIPSYIELHRARLDFMRSMGLSTAHLNSYDMSRWSTDHGSLASW